LEAVGAMEK
jgi:hypothetical protein